MQQLLQPVGTIFVRPGREGASTKAMDGDNAEQYD